MKPLAWLKRFKLLKNKSKSRQMKRKLMRNLKSSRLKRKKQRMRSHKPRQSQKLDHLY